MSLGKTSRLKNPCCLISDKNTKTYKPSANKDETRSKIYSQSQLQLVLIIAFTQIANAVQNDRTSQCPLAL